jgi:DNA-binding transcriptional ArsR family regulator
MKSGERQQANEVLRRLISIDHKTDSMGDSLAWLVQANSPQLKAELIRAFGTSKRRVQVYLSLNGERNGQDIAAHLKMSPQNVTNEMAWLKRKRLVDVLEAGREGIRYRKKFFDAVVGLSDALMQKFALDHNGRPTKAKKTRR